LLPLLDAGNLARLMGDLQTASHDHEGLLRQPAVLQGAQAGDNGANWVFSSADGDSGPSARELTLKRAPATWAYILLAVSVTRFLKQELAASLEAARQAEALAGLEQARGVFLVTKLQLRHPNDEAPASRSSHGAPCSMARVAAGHNGRGVMACHASDTRSRASSRR
jgi:hypothetical protein